MAWESLRLNGVLMRSLILTILVFTSGFALAQAPSKKDDVPRIFVTAHYVYVEATDRDSFNPHVLPENHKAIADVQRALQNWKRYILTGKRREAELVFVVRKSDLASVQGRIGVRGGTENPEKKGNSQPIEHTGVSGIETGRR